MVLWLRRWNLELDLGFKPGSATTSCIRLDRSLFWASAASEIRVRHLKQSPCSISRYWYYYYYRYHNYSQTTPFTRPSRTGEVHAGYWFREKQSLLSPFYYQKKSHLRTTPIHREKLHMLSPHFTDRKNKAPKGDAMCLHVTQWVRSRVSTGSVFLCQCQSSLSAEAST